jgi:hypothetical protein
MPARGAEQPNRRRTRTRTEQPEGETALLPKSLLGGGDCQPGEKISLEVVHVYEDEVEVKPVKGDEPDQSELGKADNQLAAMGEE